MRGGTFRPHQQEDNLGIRPAHAGVNRPRRAFRGPYQNPPRTCGGEPASKVSAWLRLLSAPHMRGRTLYDYSVCKFPCIRPAHAGVNRKSAVLSDPAKHPPRTCGGEPLKLRSTVYVSVIRPAHAGVNPMQPTFLLLEEDPPRTCGGEPIMKNTRRVLKKSAPHMRG